MSRTKQKAMFAKPIQWGIGLGSILKISLLGLNVMSRTAKKPYLPDPTLNGQFKTKLFCQELNKIFRPAHKNHACQPHLLWCRAQFTQKSLLQTTTPHGVQVSMEGVNLKQNTFVGS